MRLLALILILIAPTWAVAEKFQENLKFSDLGSGSVVIEVWDHAVGGCWTNIMEAKNYAAGQIDIVGGKVAEVTNEAYAVLYIGVSAQRRPNGLCYGYINVKVYRPMKYDGKTVLGVFSTLTVLGGSSENLNNGVLDVIKVAIAEWR